MLNRQDSSLKRTIALALTMASLLASAAIAQPCGKGLRAEGTVIDATSGRISGASVATATGETTTTDAAGHFVFSCLPSGKITLTVSAEGFAQTTVTADKKPGDTAAFSISLSLAQVETTVDVGSDDSASDPNHTGGSRTLGTNDIAQLADDPDDLQRQLQVLGAASGGTPGSATITVDGFQNSSAMPPKGSIAAIRVNPDSFSPEYEQPPFQGGHIDIITKAGAAAFHGALFLTDSDGSFNATDPFSVTATPAGKRRYGFELSGPIVKKHSDFSLALEKRDIDEFNVVNAVTLDPSGQPSPLHQTVSAPQRLWIASARGALQLGKDDTAVLSFAANTNAKGNQGIGGLTLAEAGYDSTVSEYDLRFNNTQTLGPNLLHQTRVGYSWKRTLQTPLSTAPQLEVAGYFTGGGATSQQLNDRERDLEIDDDLLITRGQHSIRFGAQSFGYFIHNYDPDTFNGSFVFGGGSAPALDASGNPTGQTTTIDGLEQYRRALAGLTGGSPTTYQLTSGNPLVPFTQWRVAFYAQDAIKLSSRLTVSGGVRYNFQTAPSSFANFGPRLGLAWSIDKKSDWVLHLHAGLFSVARRPDIATQVYRLNGIRQQQALVYSPSFTAPLIPVPGSIQVATTYVFPPTLPPGPAFQTEISLEHNFPHHWHADANLFYVDNYGALRLLNINAPLVATTTGAPPDPTAALLAPRPIAPNQNIQQYQASGHFTGPVFFTTVSQQSYKRFGFFAGYAHLGFRSDVGNAATSPQSTYSVRGESSRPDGIPTNDVFSFGTLNLPGKITLGAEFDASSGEPFNAVLGTDANGDGNFNDRPAFATAPGTGIYSTRFGLLSTDAVNGDVPRNIGTMPALIHLDLNVSRAFKIGPQKPDNPRTLTFNARSANLLNHTNVTAVSTVVSSPSFSDSLSAEAARRLELGVRYAF